MEQQSSEQSSSQTSEQPASSQTTEQTQQTQQTTTEPASWIDGLAPELKSYVQTKGFKEIGDVVDSNKNLAKLLGGDRESLIQLPKERTAEAMAPFWEKVGKPKEAKEYNFETPKELEGVVPEDDINWLRDTALKHNMTREQIEPFMSDYFERIKSLVTKQSEEYEQRLTEDQKALEKDWGQAYKQNETLVQNTAKRLGLNDQEFNNLKAALGTKKAMETLYQIGRGTQEDSFHGGQSPASNILSPVDAQAQIKELMADKNFVTRFNAGDTEARKKMAKLNEVAYPGSFTA